MGVLYPSQQWAEALAKAINGNAQAQELGKNWGTDFNGSFLFEITPGSGLNETQYFYLNLKGGKALEARMVQGRSDVTPGYLVTATYADWKPVVKGQKDFVEGIIKGIFKVDGDMSKIMKNAKFVRAVANSLSNVPSEYLGE
ncbi:MAG: SCP2 sterol-binding domain-containing protein [bacterium]